MAKHIFVGGSNGSGTRIPQVILENEGYFIGDIIAKELDYLPFAALKSQLIYDEDHPFGINGGVRTNTHRKLLDALFSSFPGDKWSIKHGFLMLAIPNLLKAFPDMKFILMVRHGVDVALNRHRMDVDIGPFCDWDNTGDALEKRVKFWSYCNEKALKDGELLKDNFLVIKFEDIVQNPEPEIKKLFDFIGIKSDLDKSLGLIKNSGTIGRRENDFLIQMEKFPYFADLDRERLFKVGKKTLEKFGYEL